VNLKSDKCGVVENHVDAKNRGLVGGESPWEHRPSEQFRERIFYTLVRRDASFLAVMLPS
jgi:hypothetical protein